MSSDAEERGRESATTAEGDVGVVPSDRSVSDRPETAAGQAVAASTGTTPERRWDVVVVGGGVGGLAAASLLAKAGRRVLLLERSPQVGGACVGVLQDGHRYDLGVSLITGAGPHGAVAGLCERLGISLPIAACDPTVQVALPRHRLSFPLAVDGWWPEIHREFPDDEAGWHGLLSDLALLAGDRERLARSLPPLPPIGWRSRLRCWRTLHLPGVSAPTRHAIRQLRKAAATPFRDTLEEHGVGAASRQALEACLWYLLLRGGDECSTLEAAIAFQRLREGVAVMPSGPAALAEALAGQIRERGGEIRLGTEAAGCVADRGRIVGVTTTTGEMFRAHWVVTDVPPGTLTQHLLPRSRGRFRRDRITSGPWEPRYVAQVLGVTIPRALLPSELGVQCFVVLDAERPAQAENLVFVRRAHDDDGTGATSSLARLSIGRFVPPSAPTEDAAVTAALLEALDQILPGAAEAVVHRALLPSAVLGDVWGRPAAVVRYEADSREWLGRRGLAHEVGWPGLLAVGEWTHPGRLVSDVVEGATYVADVIAAAA
jgi:phytoene dehydrogenase-like protein